MAIFTKVTNAQQDYVQSSDTDFHANRTTNVASMDTNSFTPLSKVIACTTPTLTKLTISH